MHDGAPCHKAKSITKFLAEKDVKNLSWPGYSPDMNPIANLWGIVKKRLKKKKHYNNGSTD
jgi:transposase